MKTPWLSMISSPAVWALNIVCFSQAWGYYTIMTNVPTYMTRVLHFDMTQVGSGGYDNLKQKKFSCTYFWTDFQCMSSQKKTKLKQNIAHFSWLRIAMVAFYQIKFLVWFLYTIGILNITLDYACDVF